MGPPSYVMSQSHPAIRRRPDGQPAAGIWAGSWGTAHLVTPAKPSPSYTRATVLAELSVLHQRGSETWAPSGAEPANHGGHCGSPIHSLSTEMRFEA
jgi:hypothetical protein